MIQGIEFAPDSPLEEAASSLWTKPYSLLAGKIQGFLAPAGTPRAGAIGNLEDITAP
jgi:hypothetical protein